MRHYNVIVAGGGPAGVAAAIAAARNGAKTLLVEKEPFLGGMATLAGVPAFGPFTNGVEDLIGGIGREILENLKKECYRSPFFDRHKKDRIEGIDWFPIDPEILKRVLDTMVVESGCDVLFYTTVVGVNKKEAGRLESLVLHNKGGTETISADYVIDCTGDADVAVMAGADFMYGDDKGRVQAGTLCFRVAGVDIERFMEYANREGEDGNLSVASKKARDDGAFFEGEMKIGGIAFQAEGVAGLNFGHVYDLKPLDAWDLSRAELEARQKLPKYLEFLRNYVPGMEKCVLVASGPFLGVRESRRICGEYVLTAEDYFARAKFEDAIARCAYPIDMHATVLEEKASEDLYRTSKYKNGEYYEIPYRALIPKGFSNLAVAGRTISSDRAMMASVRIMNACFATGQAAGTAAAKQVCEKNN